MWVASVDLGYALLPNASLFFSFFPSLSFYAVLVLVPYVAQLFKLWMGDLRLQFVLLCIVLIVFVCPPCLTNHNQTLLATFFTKFKVSPFDFFEWRWSRVSGE